MIAPINRFLTKILNKIQKPLRFYALNIIIICGLVGGSIACLNVIIPNHNRVQNYSYTLKPGEAYQYSLLSHDSAFEFSASSRCKAVLLDPSLISDREYSYSNATYFVASGSPQIIRFYCLAGSSITLDSLTGKFLSLSYSLTSNTIRISQPIQSETGSLRGGVSSFFMDANVSISLKYSGEYTLKLDAPSYSSNYGSESASLNVVFHINRTQFIIPTFDELPKYSASKEHPLEKNDVGKSIFIKNIDSSEAILDFSISQDFGIYWITIVSSLVLIFGLLSINRNLLFFSKTWKIYQILDQMEAIAADWKKIVLQENFGSESGFLTVLIFKLKENFVHLHQIRQNMLIYEKWTKSKKMYISEPNKVFQESMTQISEFLIQILDRIFKESQESLTDRITICITLYRDFHETLNIPISNINIGWFSKPLSQLLQPGMVTSIESMNQVEEILKNPCKLPPALNYDLNKIMATYFNNLRKENGENLEFLLAKYQQFVNKYPTITQNLSAGLDLPNEIKVIKTAIKLQATIENLSIDFNHAHLVELTNETGCLEHELELILPQIISKKYLDIQYDPEKKRVKFQFDLQDQIDDLFEGFEENETSDQKKI